MTITKVNPAGWGVGDSYTHDQANSFDTKIVTALDKTGDTITSATITMDVSSVLQVGWGAGATIPTVDIRGGKLILESDGTHAATVTGSAFAMTVSGTSSIAFTGTSTMTFGTGTVATWGSSATLNVNGSLVVGGLAEMTNGSAMAFDSGSTLTMRDQYVALHASHAGRTQSVRYPLISEIVYGSGWTNTVDGIKAPVSSSGTPGQLTLPPLWNGATLTTVTLYFTPAPGGRDGTLPAVPQSLQLLKRQVSAGTPLPSWTVVGTATYTQPVYATYINGNAYAVTLTVSEVIDRSAYEYAIKIVDESSTHAVGGSVFHHSVVTYTITNLQPQ